MAPIHPSPRYGTAQLDSTTPARHEATLVLGPSVGEGAVEGLAEEDEDRWSMLGPRLFYGTTSDTADMKWVTLPGHALQSGMEMTNDLMRAIEVAGLAPIMTRSPGHERAFGQAAAVSRARSVAASYALGWGSTLSRCFTLFRSYRPGTPSPINLTLDHGYGLSDQAMEAAQLLARLYLDSKGGVPPTRFWMEMRRLGVVADDVDVEEIAGWSRTAEEDLERERLQLEKGKLVEGAKRARKARGAATLRAPRPQPWAPNLAVEMDPGRGSHEL